MKGKFLLHLLLFFQLFMADATPVFASKAFNPQSLWLQVNSIPYQGLYHNAASFTSADEMAQVHFKTKYQGRAQKLFKALQAVTSTAPVKFDYTDMENIVRFVKAAKAKTKYQLKNRHSIYIHPGDGSLIKLPVQIYADGTTYVHLRKLDPHTKHGGYKSFSRSIDLKTGKAYASLVTEIKASKDARVILDELEKMNALRNIKHLLGFRDVDAYVDWDENKALKHHIAFQAELYDGDLSAYVSYLAKTPRELAKVAYEATLALQNLHRRGYIHRDIKPNNFFVRHMLTQMELVLADLGLAHGGFRAVGLGLAGTRGFIAPELCVARLEKGVACQSWQDGEKADIFGLGMTLLTLLHDESGKIRQKVYKINLIAMPKKGVEPTATMDEALTELRAYHHSLASQSSSAATPNAAVAAELRAIIWGMLDPNPLCRSSLEDVIKRLAPLRQGQDA